LGVFIIPARALAAAVALTLCVAQPAHAQSDRSGRIEGVLFDSVHARPFAGVQVVAFGTGDQMNVRAAATSDTAGHYHIDSLAPGRYAVGFESPFLDSLEITLASRVASVAPAGAAHVDLAMPPAAKLRAALCPGVSLPKGTGVIYGHVVSAESEKPLAGVVLALAWHELDVDRKTLRTLNADRAASVTTDAGGWYRACGVPTGAWVQMQLQHEDHLSPVIRALVDDTIGIAIRHLSFSDTESRADADSGATRADSVAVALSGTAVLSGIVLDSAGVTVAGAELHVRGTASVERTGATGRFALRGLPAGTQMLEVRRVGYEATELPVELRDGATTTRDVRLRKVIVTLDSLRIVARRTHYPEFQKRREHDFGGGIFIGPEEMPQQHVVFTSDIVQKVPGFRVVDTGAMATVMDGRRASGCRTNIVIDGLERQSINDVQPSEIGAIEFYRSGTIAPWFYDRGCGAIVIWTKRR